MKEFFQFSQTDITRILYEELVRTGKVEQKACSVTTTFVVNFGSFKHIDIRIDEPKPGVRSLY